VQPPPDPLDARWAKTCAGMACGPLAVSCSATVTVGE
jgi:hypothetical protein